MADDKYKVLARRLVLRGIADYRKRFVLEEDLISGEEKRRILQEIDKISDDIKQDRTGDYKRKYEDTKRRLEHLASLDDCNEEFEM